MKKNLSLLWVLFVYLALADNAANAQNAAKTPEMFFQTASQNGSVAASPDGHYLLVGGEGFIKGWDIRLRRFVFLVPVEGVCLRCAWAPDSRRFAAAVGNWVSIYDATTQTELAKLPETTLWGGWNRHQPLAWSPDGEWLATSKAYTEKEGYALRKNVQVWDTHTYTLTHTLLGHSEEVGDFAWSPDNKFLATGSDDKSVRLWSMPDGKLMHTLKDNPLAVTALAWSPDGRHLLAALSQSPTQGYDNTHIVWNTSTWQIEHTAPVDHWHRPSTVGFLSDNRTFYIETQNPQVSVWSLDKTQPLRHFEDVISSDSTLLADGHTLVRACRLYGVRTCDLQTGQATELIPREGGAHQIQISSDGRTLFSFGQGNQHAANGGLAVGVLWDTETMRARRVFSTSAHAMRLSPDGTRLAETDTEKVTLWDTRSAAMLGQWPLKVWQLDFSANGQFLGGWNENERTAYLWNLADVQAPRTLRIPDTEGFQGFQLSPDGHTFLLRRDSSSNPTTQPLIARLFDTATGGMKGTLEDFTYPGWTTPNVVFTPNSRFIFGATPRGKGNVKLWDAQTGKVVRVFGSADVVSCVMLSPDGKVAYNFSGCHDNYTWDLASGERKPFSDAFSGGILSPDGRYLYGNPPREYINHNGLTVWDFKTQRLLTSSFVFPAQGISAAWLTRTADGFYDASPDAGKWFGWQTKDGYKSATEMEAQFHRPDLVSATLSGERKIPGSQLETMLVMELETEPVVPPTPVAPAQTSPSKVSKLTLRPGEIALSGRVVAFDEATQVLTLEVVKFTLPSGKVAAIAPAKRKSIRLTPQTILPQSRLMNQKITVVGPDAGTGTSMTARQIKVE